MFEEEKKPKKKRVISAERKAQLLENLKKGRETSKINRAKKKKAKEILKADKNEEIDNIIINNRKKKENKNTELEELRAFKKQYEERMTKQEKPFLSKNYNNKEKVEFKEVKEINKPVETPYEKKKISFVDKSLVTKVDTETEKSFSTFHSVLWD
tara:strand:+ start:1251 stop:1715 length:465 start_codon:yes stop_codon:yes gene_type:complete